MSDLKPGLDARTGANPPSPDGTTGIAPQMVPQLLIIYRTMVTARELDRAGEQFVARGEAFFRVSGAGHEAVAALAPHLSDHDWLHCHYRDKALMLARGVAPEMFFLSLFCKDGSHSRGRQMSAHMSWREGNLLSLCGPVGNNALQAVGLAAEVARRPGAPIVLCALGDGTTQEGEVLEAIGEAVRRRLPVLFLVEDNRYAISTVTPGMTFFSRPDGEADSFYGMPIRRIDGRDPIACYAGFGDAVNAVRAHRAPALVLLQVERLTDHTNADDQSVYRAADEIEHARAHADPITRLESSLSAAGLSRAELVRVREDIRRDVQEAGRRALAASEPKAVFDAKRPLPAAKRGEYRGGDADRPVTMLNAIKEVLRSRMQDDERITLYGQDIEDPKGDVFGITRGLSTQFPGRVGNSPLSESTIVGTAIGRALAGGRPVAFLQFADFLPLALNQIVAELGSMQWRTDSAWECPVIVMIPCGGYRPGLGPFHAQSLEAMALHVPGIDVVMPSNAADAAGLLHAAFDSGRPTLFFYPKACLNDRSQATSADLNRHYVPLGIARVERRGSDLTLVSYGNGVERCRKTADALATVGLTAEVIDLRSLSPWDEGTVLASVRKTGRLIVVHEDNRSCGMGAEIAATVSERADVPVRVTRVVREDTYVPCNFQNQLEVLPSFERVLEAAARMLDLDLTWQRPQQTLSGLVEVEAVGNSPSDESVLLAELHVAIGDHVEEGQLLGTFETAKALMDLESPASGVVAEICVSVGEVVKVGGTLLRLRAGEEPAAKRQSIVEDPGTPVLRRRGAAAAPVSPPAAAPGVPSPVAICGVGVALGSRSVDNDEIAPLFASRSPEEIYTLTGIRSRRRAGPDEDLVTLGARAARRLLDQHGLTAADLDLLICSTITPREASPSVACQVLHRLSEAEVPAFDLNAACSGYLYGLQVAYDFLQSRPSARVMLVTSEVLSPLLDPSDFSTNVIFGDAATATLLGGSAHVDGAKFTLGRPVLGARGEPGQVLRVPTAGSTERIFMDGQKVFSEAVRRMTASLKRAVAQHGLNTADLDVIVPHQANQRILDAVAQRLRVPAHKVYSNVERLGNTSSSTIPLCLSELQSRATAGQKLGLVAFGGGFTYGAAVVQSMG